MTFLLLILVIAVTFIAFEQYKMAAHYKSQLIASQQKSESRRQLFEASIADVEALTLAGLSKAKFTEAFSDAYIEKLMSMARHYPKQPQFQRGAQQSLEELMDRHGLNGTWDSPGQIVGLKRASLHEFNESADKLGINRVDSSKASH